MIFADQRPSRATRASRAPRTYGEHLSNVSSVTMFSSIEVPQTLIVFHFFQGPHGFPGPKVRQLIIFRHIFIRFLTIGDKKWRNCVISLFLGGTWFAWHEGDARGAWTQRGPRTAGSPREYSPIPWNIWP